MWHVTQNTWHLIPDSWQAFFVLFLFFLYQCYYLHTLTDSVSPVCGIFKTGVTLWHISGNHSMERVWATQKRQNLRRLFRGRTPLSLAHVARPGCYRVFHWDKQLGDVKIESFMFVCRRARFTCVTKRSLLLPTKTLWFTGQWKFTTISNMVPYAMDLI